MWRPNDCPDSGWYFYLKATSTLFLDKDNDVISEPLYQGIIVMK
jgi:hypothetical protein